MQNKRRDGLLHRAAEIFDIPDDTLPGISNIEICGNSEVLIENHKGILEYDDNHLAVNVGRHLLSIEGQNLKISAMNNLGLRLFGEIISVVFKPI